jgi:flagellin
MAIVFGNASRLNTNIGAINALNALNDVNRDLGIRQLRLSTGKRVNSAFDDPSGFAIGTRAESRRRALVTALDNAGIAKNLLSIAEGGLDNITQILVQISEKTSQAANSAVNTQDRRALALEVAQLVQEIADIQDETSFNNVKLLDGNFTSRRVQTGTASGDFLSVNINIRGNAFSIMNGLLNTGNIRVTIGAAGQEILATATSNLATRSGRLLGSVISTSTLTKGVISLTGVRGTIGGVNIRASSLAEVVFFRTAQSAASFLSNVTTAINRITSSGQDTGASILRLTVKENQLTAQTSNVASAISRIMDADVAKEQLEATRLQILQQTAVAQLAQSNIAPQIILTLFR